MSRQITTSRTNETKTGCLPDSTCINPLHPHPSPQVRLLQLQSLYGNRAVQKMYNNGVLQAKLTIGKSGDKYEKEAENIANCVMNMPEPAIKRQDEKEEEVQIKPFAEKITPLVQKQAVEENEVPTQPEEEQTPQAKLVQQQEEKENIQKQETIKEDEPQAKQFIQREEKEEEESPQTKLFVQKQNDSKHTLSSSTETSIRSIKGSGNPLPVTTRKFMEDRFDSNFHNVRIHTDTRADTLAGSMNARAFTLGNDIVFKSGQYSPETNHGKHLLAHELTHVVQQNPGISRKNSSQPILHQTREPKVQGIWNWVKEKAKKTWKGVKKFGSKIAKEALDFLQKAKDFITDQVRSVPGYGFVASLLGKDPISGNKVKSKGGLLQAVFSLLGKEKIYDQLIKANIVGKAVKMVKDSFNSANLTSKFIIGSIKKIWSVISINPLTWRKAAGMFVNFLGSLYKKAIKIGWSLLTEMPLLILEGFLILVGAPVKKIMGILNKGKQVILKIASNPIAFIGNLFKALKKGFFQFKDNIWKHLKAGLMGWLMGTMEGADIQLPQKWDLKGIVYLILQILGLTYQRIRSKVVKKLGPKGEQIVSFMEKTVSFIVMLVTKGPMALWERIEEKAGEIKKAAIDAIKNWIITKIVVAAVTKLATMFNPVGAIVQAALGIYNTVMFFIERAKQIAAVVQAIFNSIAPIAFGKISKAANWIEKIMARSIPVLLSFLARLIGLGGISKKIKNVIIKIRKPIDKIVDKVIDWIVEKAKKLFGKGKDKKINKDGKVTGQALAEINQSIKNKKIRSTDDFKKKVSVIHKKYKGMGLKYIKVDANPNIPVKIKASASPEESFTVGLDDLIYGDQPIEKQELAKVKQFLSKAGGRPKEDGKVIDFSKTYSILTLNGKIQSRINDPKTADDTMSSSGGLKDDEKQMIINELKKNKVNVTNKDLKFQLDKVLKWREQFNANLVEGGENVNYKGKKGKNDITNRSLPHSEEKLVRGPVWEGALNKASSNIQAGVNSPEKAAENKQKIAIVLNRSSCPNCAKVLNNQLLTFKENYEKGEYPAPAYATEGTPKQDNQESSSQGAQTEQVTKTDAKRHRLSLLSRTFTFILSSLGKYKTTTIGVLRGLLTAGWTLQVHQPDVKAKYKTTTQRSGDKKLTAKGLTLVNMIKEAIRRNRKKQAEEVDKADQI